MLLNLSKIFIFLLKLKLKPILNIASRLDYELAIHYLTSIYNCSLTSSFALKMPFSVIIPEIYFAGVTSKAGFAA